MNGRAELSQRVQRWALLVALAALLAYATAIAGDYVFDDYHSIVGNTALHDLGNLGRYWTDPAAFSGSAARMYRPALLSSFAVNWAISPSPWSLRAGNVLLHATTAVLLFVWTWRLSRRLRAAAFVAAAFAVHPLASEAINLVSARSELLAALGMLTALLGQLSVQRGHGRVGPWLAIVAGAVLACGSKETGVVLPALCVGQALWHRHGRPGAGWRRTALALLPVVALVICYLVARKLLLGQATVQLLGRTGSDPLSGYGRTLTMQLATMGTLLPRALLQTVWPWPLSIDPVVHYRDSLLAPAVLLGWGTMGALSWWACRAGAGARLRRFGVAFAWLTALPWIVVPLNMPLAEHRLYLPMLGLALVALGSAPALRRAWRRLPQALPGWLAATVLLAAAVGAADRSLLYRDERMLWRAELARSQDSFRAWWGLGTSSVRAGDVLGGIEPLARAHALHPSHEDTLRTYTEALLRLPESAQQPERLLAAAQSLQALRPDDPWARTLVVQAHLRMGHAQQDHEHFAAAERIALSCLQIAPPKGFVYRLAAMACRGRGDLAGALAHLDTSVARGLAPVGVRIERAHVLRELGRADDARRELLLAQQVAPMDPELLGVLQHWAAPGR